MLTVECDEGTEPSSTGTPNASDDCSGYNVTYSDNVTPGTCANEKTIVRTWTATDGCGNTATCDQTIAVTDDTPPTVTCPPDVTMPCGYPTNPFVTGFPQASDECGDVTVTHSDGPTTGDCPYSFDRTWTATDECGHEVTCTQVISIDDFTPPLIVCPPDTTIDCDDPTTPNRTGMAGAIDQCSNVIVTYQDSPITGQCPGDLSFIRTWIAIDDCDNMASCDQVITIEDDTPPTIVCPPNVTIECELGGGDTGTATATDDCGAATVTFSDGPGAGECPSTFVRTWTATDECENTAICYQLITIDDDTAPVIVCPPDVTVTCDDDTDPSGSGEATATDDCTTVMVTYDDGEVTGDCPYTFTRTWTATDGCGNTATCDQTITVTDDTPPTIICPPDVTLECTDPQHPFYTGEAQAGDDCGDVTLTWEDDATTGQCLGEESIVRTWTATDSCGNSVSCDQFIFVEDNDAPLVICPFDVTLACGDSTNPTDIGGVQVFEPCSWVTVVHEDVEETNDCIDITRTWTITDSCGNETNCVQQIIILDTTPPTITCPPDVSVDCASNDPFAFGSATASDECGVVDVTYTDGPMSGDCPASFTRTWTATDLCGNSASCDQVISIDDDEAPSILCPVDVTLECNAATDPTSSATASDNCTDVTVTYTDGPLSGDCPATFTRTWTATDACGNSASCDQEITVDDDEAPILIGVPADETLECDEPVPAPPTVTAEDNCGGTSTSGGCATSAVSANQGTRKDGTPVLPDRSNPANALGAPDAIFFSLGYGGELVVMFDAPVSGAIHVYETTYGNYPEEVAEVYVSMDGVNWTYIGDANNLNGQPTTDPILSVLPFSGCAKFVRLVDATDASIHNDSSDGFDVNAVCAPQGCGGGSEIEVTYEETSIPGTCEDEQVITRTWTATDECGNEASDSQEITVVDTTPPVITCPADVTLDCDGSTDTGAATATDNCDDNPEVTYSDTNPSGDCPQTITRTWTATDNCGNESSCDQLISVDDDTPPVITCPADTTVECDESTDPADTGEATASDDCGEPTVTYSDATTEGTCDQEYTITRTWTATDMCGNSDTCDQVIEVADSTPPTITCPADVTLDCEASTDTGTATATDNCDDAPEVTFSDSTPTGDCPQTITRTWTATDDCGNSASCDQLILVDDNTPPTITCPADVTVECDESTDPADTGEALADDDCSSVTVTYSDSETPGTCDQQYTITRTWTATDMCGNSDSCDQIIEVVDTTPPAITCPADVSLGLGDSTDQSDTGEATASDNCGSVTITFSDDTTGSTGCDGTITRTWTATDECGNSSTCDQSITFECTQDYGDLPEGYPTLEVDNGPRHDIVPGAPVLGADIDPEADGQPSPNADGDDNDGNDDEDGVLLPESLIPGEQQGVDVTVAGTGLLNAWIDFNGDSDFDDPGEQIANDLLVSDETVTLLVDTPVDAVSGLTGARFRVSSAGGDAPTGLAQDGEVEDYLVVIKECDYGDLPGPYPTVHADDGAVHIIRDTGPILGSSIDPEQDGQPDPDALGDDNDGNDDEDGVTFVDPFVQGNTAEIDVTVTGDGFLDAWIDFNGDGDFDDPGEQIADNLAVTTGTTTLVVNVPVGAVLDTDLGTRFRVSSEGDLDPTGLAQDGEVEDYLVVVNMAMGQLQLEKSVVEKLIGPLDEEIHYLFDVSNDGNLGITNVVLTDTQCDPVTFVTGDDNNDMVLDPGEVWMYECTDTDFVFERGTIFTNKATVTGQDLAGNEKMDMDTAEVPMVGFNLEKQVDKPKVCFGDKVTFTLITRLYAPEGFPVELEVLSVVDDTCSPLTVVSGDTNAVGNLVVPPGTNVAELINMCMLNPTESITNIATETVRFIFDGVPDTNVLMESDSAVVIVDTVAPVFTFCPGDVTLDCNDSTEPATPATAEDECFDTTVTYSDAPSVGTCPITFDRTWTATDECGNATNCVQTITIDDTTDPTITCPADTTVECDESTDPANTGEPVVSDDCDNDPDVTYSDVATPGTCEEESTITRTWTVTDICGNESTCDQTITIVDSTPPVITCPIDATLDCAASTDAGTATATDNCDADPTVTFSDSTPAGDCPVTITRTWTATDNCGNESSCDQSIMIDDDTPPTITCPADTTVECDASTDPADTGEPTYDDDCSDVTVTFSDDVADGTCPQESTITRTWTATDACGNTASCDQVIEVVDTTPPTITCPPDATLDCNSSTDTGTAVVDDNCGSVTVTFDDSDPSGDCPQTVTRTWTATDECGNSASCDQTITIDDDEPPTITCPPDVTVECNDSTDPADTGEASGSDDCTTVTVTFEDGPLSGVCPATFTRTWTATDGCGNTATCDQDITISDDEAPVLSGVPADVTIECGNEIPAPPVMTADDNCGQGSTVAGCTTSTVSANQGLRKNGTPVLPERSDPNNAVGAPDANFFSLGFGGELVLMFDAPISGAIEVHEKTNGVYPEEIAEVYVSMDGVNWTLIGEANNLNGQPTTNPLLSVIPFDGCAKFVRLVDATDASIHNSTADAFDVVAVCATLGCSGSITVTFNESSVPGTCEGEEVITRTWTATDDCGNATNDSQTITVEDTTPPTITCPADVTIECDDTGDTGTATADDECSEPTVTYDDSTFPGTCPQEYTIVRTWTATDDCGNESECDQSISVQDTTPPVINCPPDVTIECRIGSLTNDTNSVVFSDNCGDATVTYSDSDVSGACPATVIRTWTATDECGNSSSCDQTITIDDTTPPTITCPADATVECGEDTEPFATGEADAEDNCEDPTVTYSDVVAAGTCPQESTITRTWTATDACGNESSCDQVIEVVDSTPPVITCPNDVTLDCNDSTDIGAATALDACGSVTVTFSDGTPSGTCPTIIVRTWTATDECGNTADCDQVLTIDDEDAPLLSCPADTTVECDESTDPSDTGEPTYTDECSSVDVTYDDSVSPGTCQQEITITRTWTATDECGNIATCDQVIDVVDTTAPVITCPADVTLTCDDSTETGPATATDNCSVVSITFSDTAPVGTCQSEIIRTWTATDLCGNTSECQQSIVVDDDQPPTITCPVDTTVECDEATNPAVTGEPAVDDDCSAVTVTYLDDLTPGSCSSDYTIVRTWTATDGCGNTADCDQVIEVADTTPPTIACPPAATLMCDGEEPSAPTALDNCGSASITYEDGPVDGDCPYTFTRTWYATDSCGNQASCDQDITVDDSTPPTIICPPDATIECTVSQFPANTGIPQAADECGSVTLTFSDDATTGDCLGSETIVRTWTAIDGCGNEASCDQFIFIEDNTPPTLECPDDVTLNCGDEIDPANVGGVTVFDACSFVFTTFDDVWGTNCPIIVERTWTSTDDCGNSASCVQLITLIDNLAPVIECPDDITVECDESTAPVGTGMASAEDDCLQGVTLTFADDVEDGNCIYERVITRTWTATDRCGNSISCDQEITVEDSTPPTILCPADLTLECDDDTSPADAGSPIASDNCGVPVVTYTDALQGDECAAQITRTWTATDVCGNETSCDQVIVIEDATPPVIECPADVTIECDESTDPFLVGMATATDNCDDDVDLTYVDDVMSLGCIGSEVIIRTWTATDDCGNATDCDQVIIVQDATPPIVFCPSDVTIDCEESTDPIVTGGVQHFDPCSPVYIEFDDNILSACPTLIERYWTIEDDCGNETNCLQFITVVDDTPPTVDCPADITLECDEPNGLGETGVATADDNCSIPEVTYADSVAPGACAQEEVITRTWTATDACGLTAECDQVITIQDTTPPVIVCPADLTLECDGQSVDQPSVSDNCDPNPSVTFTDNNPSGECPFTVTRTWTATDACGNSVDCDQLITIDDTIPPAIDCPANLTLECGASTDPTDTGEPVAFDTCTSVTVTFNDQTTPGTCPQESLIRRTWTATDACGNSDDCVQFILIQDTTPPTITCPANVTLDCEDSTDSGTASASDNCGQTSLTFSDSQPSGVCPLIITRTWTAEDECGNTSSCDQLIVIDDTTPPTITCPVDTTVECDASTDPSDTGEATASDNCTEVTVTYNDSESPGTCVQESVITRTWTATDACGNSTNCEQVIEVVDTTPPVIICPADATLDCDSSTSVGSAQATATDNCGEAFVTFSNGSPSGDCPATFVRTWTAEDACGNTASCDQVVLIDDATPPTIDCPADVTVECDESTDPTDTGEPSVEDNCSTVSVTFSDDVAQGTCAQEYIITRTWTATDACGNEASCDQEIEVVDTTAPVITCPLDVTLTAGMSTDPQDTGSPNASDNCGTPSTTFSDETAMPDECTEVITRTWTATDDCGNGDSCEQTITLVCNFDFGDAPDPDYPTLLANDGPRHIIVPDAPVLGSIVDTDPDGQPNAAATGDDTDGTDDEDGVVFPESLIPGEQQGLDVTVTGSGLVNAWIDFNGDGDFDDPGEQIASDLLLTDETITLLVDTPADAVSGTTYARFRISTAGGDAPTGEALDGEVEDYAIVIKPCDFGDLPGPYPTLYADDGPRHIILPGAPMLGTTEDAEGDGQPDPMALGDDSNGIGDDEDGIDFQGMLMQGLPVDVEVTVTGSGLLNGFIDFNGDGDFDDPGEQVFTDEPVVDGVNMFTINVPLDAVTDVVGARFRISTAGGDGPTGLAVDGEVEDYLVEIGASMGDIQLTKAVGVAFIGPEDTEIPYTFEVTKSG